MGTKLFCVVKLLSAWKANRWNYWGDSGNSKRWMHFAFLYICKQPSYSRRLTREIHKVLIETWAKIEQMVLDSTFFPWGFCGIHSGWSCFLKTEEGKALVIYKVLWMWSVADLYTSFVYWYWCWGTGALRVCYFTVRIMALGLTEFLLVGQHFLWKQS